jgi:hypothetical protein
LLSPVVCADNAIVRNKPGRRRRRRRLIFLIEFFILINFKFALSIVLEFQPKFFVLRKTISTINNSTFDSKNKTIDSTGSF